MNLATLRNGSSFGEMIDDCLRHGVTAISPWRDQIEEVGLAEAARIVEANELRVTGFAAAACFQRAAPRGGRRASRTICAPSTRRRRWAPTARAGGRWAAGGEQDLAGARQMVARRHLGDAALCQGERRSARDRAAASDVCGGPRLREHDRPGARYLRDAGRAGRRGDRRLSRVVGPRSVGGDRAGGRR